MTRLGIGLKRAQGLGLSKSGSLYVPAAQALFARMTTPPTAARKTLINNLIVSLQVAGVWSKLDCLYLMAAADSQAAGLNWVQNAYNLTAVNSPTFTTNRGYAGDGSSSYLDTGFNPAVAVSPKYQVGNNALIGVYSLTELAALNVYEVGNSNLGGTVTGINPRQAAAPQALRGGLNSTGAGNFGAGNSSIGDFSIQQTISTTLVGYINGVNVGTLAVTAAPGASANMTICRAGGNYGTRQIACGRIGAAFTDAQEAAFYAAETAYLHGVGAI